MHRLPKQWMLQLAKPTDAPTAKPMDAPQGMNPCTNLGTNAENPPHKCTDSSPDYCTHSCPYAWSHGECDQSNLQTKQQCIDHIVTGLDSVADLDTFCNTMSLQGKATKQITLEYKCKACPQDPRFLQ